MIFINNPIFAQNKFEAGFDFKPQLTSLSGKDNFINSHTNSRKEKTIISFGLSLGYNMKDKIIVSTGVNYNPQGIAKEKVTINNIGESYFKTDMDYLRIPIKFSFSLFQINDFRFKISTGLGVNYLLKVEDNLINVLDFVNSIIKEPDERYNKFVFDVLTSFGFDCKISDKLYLETNLEGLYGINKFHKKYYLGSNGNIEIDSKNCSLGLIIGLRYKL
ncbi:MAG: outer membrane beta-barrel protein [Paludibacter sp.]